MRPVPDAVAFTSKKNQNGSDSVGMKSLKALALLGAGVSCLFEFAGIAATNETKHGLDCPSYPWPHKGILSSYDHASIRRGHQAF